jgi:hypothetical protein
MKHKSQLLIGIALIIAIFSFRTQNDSPAHNNLEVITAADTLKLLRTLLEVDVSRGDKTAELGRRVSIDSAMQCANLFEPEMQDHAIQEDIRSVTVRITRAQMITTAEMFRGDGLLGWLVETLKPKNKIIPADKIKDIEIHVVCGIYTDKFLETYFPGTTGAAERAARKGRITAFLVPYDKKTKRPFRDGDDTAYELGGLRP